MLPAPLFAHHGDKMLINKFDGSLAFGVDGIVIDAPRIRREELDLASYVIG